MNKSPLNTFHVRGGAKMTPFAGWEMPVQFKGILSEHKAVREKAGIFDISHMGQLWVTGGASAGTLQKIVTNDVFKLEPGKGQYALMCREDGCVVDDLFIYCLELDRYLLIVNASRTPIDFQWIKDRCRQGVEVQEQPLPGALALQGPAAESILRPFCAPAASLPHNGVGEFKIDEMEYIISRTGYTGEDGFEIFAPAGHVVSLYSQLLKTGEPLGLEPCGLGARDTLRLEMGYRLYGQDLDEQHTALESGLGWVVKLDKADFTGKESLEREKARGSARRFVAFRLADRGIPRHGHAIVHQGKPVGEVTSGTFSPSLQVGIGMGYIDNLAFPKDSAGGFAVRVHDREVPAEQVTLPFYRKEKIAAAGT